MGGIADQEQATEAHRLGDEGSERRDRLLEGRSGDHRLGMMLRQPPAQLVPEALVGPVLDLFVQRALNVVAAARLRAHRAQCETTRMVGVDEFVIDRRHVGEDAEPAERIDLFEGVQGLFGN
ncbi:hypothetical protein D9M70_493130 [compost metagenome]